MDVKVFAIETDVSELDRKAMEWRKEVRDE